MQLFELRGRSHHADTAFRWTTIIAATLVLVILGLRGVRTSRFGRALVALRDNEAAAESYALDPLRVRLAAFALSGAIAALAGGLFVHHERAFDPTSYSPIENLVVLTMVVVGGMTALAGAVLGALFLFGTRWFLEPEWQFLASGIGVLLVLLLAPGGLAGLVYRLRDRWLRVIAGRLDLAVPGYSPASAPPAADAPASATPPTSPASPGTCHLPRRLPFASPDGPRRRPARALLEVPLEAGYGGVPLLTTSTCRWTGEAGPARTPGRQVDPLRRSQFDSPPP